MSKEIILHVGANKCGSSSIQTALTTAPCILRPGREPLYYGVLDAVRGQVLAGDEAYLDRRMSGYVAWQGARQQLEAPLEKLAEDLKARPESAFLFSCEGWLSSPEHMETVLERLDVEVDTVIAYVRPQVPLLNSAWWQWGAWSTQKFDRWLKNRLKLSRWGHYAKAWSEIGRVRKVVVRPIRGDVVQDLFISVLGAEPPVDAGLSNTSLPGTVLRLFQRNRELRPGPHEPAMDFALSRHLTLESPPTPWVLEERHVQLILDAFREDNELLLTLMDEDSAQSVRSDPRWWSADAFRDRTAEPPGPQPLPRADLERLCVDMAQTILRLSKEIHRFEVDASRRDRLSRTDGNTE